MPLDLDSVRQERIGLGEIWEQRGLRGIGLVMGDLNLMSGGFKCYYGNTCCLHSGDG